MRNLVKKYQAEGVAKWQQLSVRDKTALKILGLFFLVYLIYAVVFQNLYALLQDKRIAVNNSQELLAYMKNADQQLAELKQDISTSHSRLTPVSLLKLLQTELKNADLTPLQLKQNGNDHVVLQLARIDFDDFSRMLIQLKNHPVTVAKLLVSKMENTPLVNVEADFVIL